MDDPLSLLKEKPTVASLPESRKPARTVCTSCPSAVWYVLPDRVHCHCRLMHAESYSSENPEAIIEMCDGVLISAMQLLKRQKKEQESAPVADSDDES